MSELCFVLSIWLYSAICTESHLQTRVHQDLAPTRSPSFHTDHQAFDLITPNVAVLEKIVLLLADRIRKRLRRPSHAVRQDRNVLTQLPVFRFQSGDSFLQDNHFVMLVDTAH